MKAFLFLGEKFRMVGFGTDHIEAFKSLKKNYTPDIKYQELHPNFGKENIKVLDDTIRRVKVMADLAGYKYLINKGGYIVGSYDLPPGTQKFIAYKLGYNKINLSEYDWKQFFKGPDTAEEKLYFKGVAYKGKRRKICIN